MSHTRTESVPVFTVSVMRYLFEQKVLKIKLIMNIARKNVLDVLPGLEQLKF